MQFINIKQIYNTIMPRIFIHKQKAPLKKTECIHSITFHCNRSSKIVKSHCFLCIKQPTHKPTPNETKICTQSVDFSCLTSTLVALGTYDRGASTWRSNSQRSALTRRPSERPKPALVVAIGLFRNGSRQLK